MLSEQSKRTWPVIFYLGSILLANWLVIRFGLIQWGTLVFPAGAVAIGMTFSARDLVQVHWGKWGCWVWMLCAGAITALLNWQIALASVAAFVISETMDWAVYTHVHGSFGKRMMISNLFGIPLDSIVFVGIAFGFNCHAILGQTIVKIISGMTVLLVVGQRNGFVAMESRSEP